MLMHFTLLTFLWKPVHVKCTQRTQGHPPYFRVLCILSDIPTKAPMYIYTISELCKWWSPLRLRGSTSWMNTISSKYMHTHPQVGKFIYIGSLFIYKLGDFTNWKRWNMIREFLFSIKKDYWKFDQYGSSQYYKIIVVKSTHMFGTSVLPVEFVWTLNMSLWLCPRWNVPHSRHILHPSVVYVYLRMFCFTPRFQRCIFFNFLPLFVKRLFWITIRNVTNLVF